MTKWQFFTFLNTGTFKQLIYSEMTTANGVTKHGLYLLNCSPVDSTHVLYFRREEDIKRSRMFRFIWIFLFPDPFLLRMEEQVVLAIRRRVKTVLFRYLPLRTTVAHVAPGHFIGSFPKPTSLVEIIRKDIDVILLGITPCGRSGRYQLFGETYCLYQPWRWQRYVPSKHLYLSTSPRGVNPQSNIIDGGLFFTDAF